MQKMSKEQNAFVQDHGQWCLERMVGTDNPLVPAASVPIYTANEQRVRDIMEAANKAAA